MDQEYEYKLKRCNIKKGHIVQVIVKETSSDFLQKGGDALWTTTDIHQRIGLEIPLRKIQFQLKQLIAKGKAVAEGQKRWTKYRIKT